MQCVYKEDCVNSASPQCDEIEASARAESCVCTGHRVVII